MDFDGVRELTVEAAAGWILVSLIVLTATFNMIIGSLLWGGFVLTVAFVASLPALARRNPAAMVPWPLLATVAIGAIFKVAGVYEETAGFLVIVALALIVVIELDTFTPVDLSRRFAVVFSVMTAMAVEGLWIVVQYISDRWFGTGLLRSQVELQWDIVIVTFVAMTIGILYQWYESRFDIKESISVTDQETQ